MFDDIYWYGSGRFFNHPSVTEKLNSLMALHDMLKREFLTVNGQFRKGKSFEWSSDEEFISAAMQKWLGDRSPGKNEFIQWLRDEGLIKTPRVTYTPDWVWVLIDTRTEIPETYKTDVYRTTYSGSTNSFSKTDEYIWDPDHYQSASFTVTCSPSPPEIIRVGDKVVMDLTAAITSNNDEEFHWGASCGVRRDRPDMGLGSAYRGYESFWATAEGAPNTCSVEAIGDWGNDPVRITSAQVYHEFGGPGAENAQDIETADGHIYRIGVYFTGCSCQTVWTYEWRNIAG